MTEKYEPSHNRDLDIIYREVQHVKNIPADNEDVLRQSEMLFNVHLKKAKDYVKNDPQIKKNPITVERITRLITDIEKAYKDALSEKRQQAKEGTVNSMPSESVAGERNASHIIRDGNKIMKLEAGNNNDDDDDTQQVTNTP